MVVAPSCVAEQDADPVSRAAIARNLRARGNSGDAMPTPVHADSPYPLRQEVGIAYTRWKRMCHADPPPGPPGCGNGFLKRDDLGELALRRERAQPRPGQDFGASIAVHLRLAEWARQACRSGITAAASCCSPIRQSAWRAGVIDAKEPSLAGLLHGRLMRGQNFGETLFPPRSWWRESRIGHFVFIQHFANSQAVGVVIIDDQTTQEMRLPG